MMPLIERSERRKIRPWIERSPEIAALLNPAFCGLLLYSALDGFVKRKGSGFSYEFVFLVIPLVLHGPTRQVLPKSIATPFQTWVSENSPIRIGLADRVRVSVSFTQESIMFLLSRKAIALENGTLIHGEKKISLTKAKSIKDGDVKECAQSAALLGRLLANAGRSATVYASLGIIP